jgi:hypothetical protein
MSAPRHDKNVNILFSQGEKIMINKKAIKRERRVIGKEKRF